MTKGGKFKGRRNSNRQSRVDDLNDDAARSLIDQEIADIEERTQLEVRSLRARRNLHAPISKLPPELLCRIFDFCRSDHPISLGIFYTDNSTIHSSFKRWIALTWVCQYWRNVALGYSELWNTPNTASANWTNEMLVRSKSSPLIIRAEGDQFYSRPKLDVVLLALGHLHRIKELHLAGIYPEQILPALNLPAPILETLQVALTNDRDIVLTQDFLRGHAPSLKSLTLTGCAIPWSSPLYSPNMVSLRIDCSPRNMQPLINTPEHFLLLLGALAKMPSLQHLELSGIAVPASIHPDLRAIPSPSRHIPLPSLAHLKLSSSTRHALNLINHLVLPKNVTYHLACHSQTDLPNLADQKYASYTDALPLIQSYCSSEPVRELELTTSRHNSFGWPNCFLVQVYLDQHYHPSKPSPTFPSQSPDLGQASFTLGQDISCLNSSPPVVAVQSYWSSMNLSGLKEVILDTPLPIKTWLHVYGVLPELEKIIVFHEAPGTLIQAMKQDLRPVTQGHKKRSNRKGKGKEKAKEKEEGKEKGKGKEIAEERKKIAFGNLKELRIICFDFNTSTPSVNTPPNRRHFTMAEDLLYVLQRRSSSRKPLEKVVIEQCELTMDDEDVFERCTDYVHDLEFDGYTGEGDYDFDDDFYDDEDEEVDWSDDPAFFFGGRYPDLL